MERLFITEKERDNAIRMELAVEAGSITLARAVLEGRIGVLTMRNGDFLTLPVVDMEAIDRELKDSGWKLGRLDETRGTREYRRDYGKEE